MSLTETKETPPTAKQRMAENLGQYGKHPEQQQTLEARGKNSSKEVKKIQGAWTTNSRNRQAKTTRTREGELPSKEGRNQDRTAAFLPSLNKRQRKKTQVRTTEGEGRQEAKATESRTRGPTSTPNRSSRRGQKTATKQPGPSEQVKDKQRNQKEDEPRRAAATAPTSQLTSAADSAGQKHIHPKASENKQ